MQYVDDDQLGEQNTHSYLILSIIYFAAALLTSCRSFVVFNEEKEGDEDRLTERQIPIESTH